MVESDPPSHSSERLNEVGALHALVKAIQARIVSGLILALPIVLTFWILYWLYTTLKHVVLDPIVWIVGALFKGRAAEWASSTSYQVLAPLVAIVLVLTILYFLGLFVRSRLYQLIDWVMLHVPVVTTIYRAIRKLVSSLDDQVRGNQFKRVVLVPFPHSGSRALAFVTNTLRDATTGKSILSVCVLTGVVPPAGFTLFVPEEEVTDIDWSVNDTLQAILSGGINAPSMLHYFGGLPPGAGVGPIVDARGEPIG